MRCSVRHKVYMGFPVMRKGRNIMGPERTLQVSGKAGYLQEWQSVRSTQKVVSENEDGKQEEFEYQDNMLGFSYCRQLKDTDTF